MPVWASLLALALGGFGIGTAEFASMGVLPDIAGALGVSISTAGHAITPYALSRAESGSVSWSLHEARRVSGCRNLTSRSSSAVSKIV
jgi:predicted MFS family arabinose efflux permease